MATSKIPVVSRPRNLGYTGNTGSVTFDLPNMGRKGALVFMSHGLFYLHFTSDSPESVHLEPIFYSATATITSNGNWNFTISGLTWYSNVFILMGWA